jgi:hypothetical protein
VQQGNIRAEAPLLETNLFVLQERDCELLPAAHQGREHVPRGQRVHVPKLVVVEESAGQFDEQHDALSAHQ